MKYLLKLFLIVNLLLVVVGSGLLGTLVAVLPTPKAAAADVPSYALYFPTDSNSLNALIKANQEDGDQGIDDSGPNSTGGILSRTIMYTKGGPLGTTALKLNAKSSDSQDHPMYSVDYYCTPSSNGHHISLDRPSANVPYIRYTWGVSILNDGDWSGIVNDPSYKPTIAGLLGDTFVGSVHFPGQPDKNLQAADFDLPGAGGTDYDLRDGVDVGTYKGEGGNREQHDAGQAKAKYSFSSYPSGGPDFEHIGDAFNACRIGPRGTVGNALNLHKQPANVKAEWDKAIKDAGLGDDVAGAAKKTSGTGGDQNAELGCDFAFDNPLTWFLCPVINMLTSIVEALDNLITDQLSIETNDIFCPKSDVCQAYHAAWASFRNMALGFMAIAGLIIVISQALGWEILDAYTIRKTLPRILIASLAITLSWQLMNFAVELSNALGFGIRHLIYLPFAQLGGNLDLSFGGSGIANLFFGTAAVGVAAVGGIAFWIAAGGIGIMLSYAATAALAVFIAVLVLVLRQIAIILMIIISPLAIVFYVLPNTQRYYKFWWESFSKALLMFPLIAAFIAAGRVFSAIAIHNGGPINQLIAFISYFAPYFLIPLTFRFAGGMLSQLGGFVNDRGSGLFRGLAKNRQEKRKQRIATAQKGGIYRNKFGEFTRPFARDEHGNRKKSSISGIANTIGNYTVDAGDTWRLKAGTKGGKLGRKLLGHQARDLQRQIERERIDHSLAAAKKFGGRYHAGRAMSGDFQYYYRDLDENGQQDLRDAFGVGKRTRGADGKMHLAEDNMVGWRGAVGEKEFLQAASILDGSENQGAREAAKELREDAITMDTLKGLGKEETQRADTVFMGKMIAAQAGRLENSELADYYNQLVAEGRPEEASMRLSALQQAAAPKRTSQAEGYGIGFKTIKDANGKTIRQEAYSVYDDPAGAEAQASVGRVGAAEIGQGKREDLIDPDGYLSGWSQALISSASEVEMESVEREVEVTQGPRKGQTVKKVFVQPKLRRNEQTGQMETIAKSADGVQKAKAQQAKLQQLDMYAQGDVGLGAAIYALMDEAGVPRYDRTGRGGNFPPDLNQAIPRAPEPPPEEGGP